MTREIGKKLDWLGAFEIRQLNETLIESGPKVMNATTPSSEIGAPTISRQDSVSSSLFREEVINQGSSNKGPNQTSKQRKNSGPQDELLEIINDFKNNVFTISEVERLVETWRNRNDVQQSFKDKQRQLNAMRDEYERIQKRIKEETKMPTPFDRIRKFFGKGKKGEFNCTVFHRLSSL